MERNAPIMRPRRNGQSQGCPSICPSIQLRKSSLARMRIHIHGVHRHSKERVDARTRGSLVRACVCGTMELVGGRWRTIFGISNSGCLKRDRVRQRQRRRVEERRENGEKRVWQELLNWSFDWTHRDGLNVISDWPEVRSARGVQERGSLGAKGWIRYPLTSGLRPHSSILLPPFPSFSIHTPPPLFSSRAFGQERGIRWMRPIDSIAPIKGTSNRAGKFRPARFSYLRI